jgi:hypothetical protein
MNVLLFNIALLIALFAWIFNTQIEYSVVYACSEVTQRDPVDVQKLCERERRGKWWMK